MPSVRVWCSLFELDASEAPPIGLAVRTETAAFQLLPKPLLTAWVFARALGAGLPGCKQGRSCGEAGALAGLLDPCRDRIFGLKVCIGCRAHDARRCQTVTLPGEAPLD